MHKCKFTLSDDEEQFEGYTDGSTYDKWANICLTRAQAKAFLDATPFDYFFMGWDSVSAQYTKLWITIDKQEILYLLSTPLPIDGGDIVGGFFIPGFEYMVVPEFDAYEIHPCIILGKDKNGKEIVEQCSEDNNEISFWSLYGHTKNEGLVCLDDFNTKEEAEEAYNKLVK